MSETIYHCEDAEKDMITYFTTTKSDERTRSFLSLNNHIEICEKCKELFAEFSMRSKV